MLIQNIQFTSTELNTAAVVKKSVTSKSIEVEDLDKTYRPTSIKVKNATNASFSYGLFTSDEYSAFTGVSGSAYSDLVTIANGTTDTYTSVLGDITDICVSGTSSHNASAEFVIIQQ